MAEKRKVSDKAFALKHRGKKLHQGEKVGMPEPLAKEEVAKSLKKKKK